MTTETVVLDTVAALGLLILWAMIYSCLRAASEQSRDEERRTGRAAKESETGERELLGHDS